MAITFAPGRGRGRADKVNVRIIGLDKLKTKFNRMKSTSDSVMTRQIHLAAERIAERANREVPVDTGRLLRSIDVELRNKFATVKVDAPYARYVEEGTKYMRAQPYILKHIKPSIDKMTANLIRLIGK